VTLIKGRNYDFQTGRGLVTSCELDRERRVVQVYIPTYEPATMCWGSVAIITEATRELVGSGWRLRINDQECPLG
jgi:hypothetical protein